MQFKTIIYETADRVATLSLNRPDSLNAFDEGMKKDLLKALSMASSDEKIRVVVFTGRGRAFCAGADLNRFKDDYEYFERTGEPPGFYDISLPRIFTSFPKLLIAAVNGPAVGVGMTMALACDIRLASKRASFSCPFTRVGLTPEFGSSYYLPRLVGYARAVEWVLTGRTVKAQEAHSTGLINHLVAPEALLDEAVKMAKEIAAMPEQAIDAARDLLRQALSSSLDETLEREMKVLHGLMTSRGHYVAVCRLLDQMKGKR
ncbi:MAG: enoyl-CoA hydratase/isomerase family protein [Desulfobacterales bacterium]|nr:enoyl-CoA hydratase/isomerase family protein [Desulfobacterales bacterium]